MTTSEQRNKARKAIYELGRHTPRVAPCESNDPTFTYYSIPLGGPGSFLEAMRDVEVARDLLRRLLLFMEGPSELMVTVTDPLELVKLFPGPEELRAFLEETK